MGKDDGHGLIVCYYGRLVPALAVGFDDVKKRMEAQERQAGAHLATLKVC